MYSAEFVIKVKLRITLLKIVASLSLMHVTVNGLVFVLQQFAVLLCCLAGVFYTEELQY